MSEKFKQAMINLYKSDNILADQKLERFSSAQSKRNTEENPAEFDLFSDKFAQQFPTYELNVTSGLAPTEKTPVLNFNQLKELLLSKDLSRMNELGGNEYRFLDREVDIIGNRVAIQSFVDSGETILRRFMEEITGVHAGSDSSTDFFELMKGSAGNGHTFDNNEVWIAKTHFPLKENEDN